MFPIPLITERARAKALPFLVIGGHAVNAYCEPRATLDIDFVIPKSDRDHWRELLEAEGFKLCSEREAFVQFSPPYGVPWRIDLMTVNDETFTKLQAAARAVEMFGVQVRIASPEHLIAMKLHALKHGHVERNAKDFGDVLALLRNTGLKPDGQPLREIFRQYGTDEIYERVREALK